MAHYLSLLIYIFVNIYVTHSFVPWSFSPLPLSGSDQNFEFNAFGGDEDASLDFIQLTAKYGYATEEHTAVTEDGYYLTLHRIPKGKHCTSNDKSPPMIIMHGLMDSSATFIVSGPESGLAYIMSDACYDIWCPNVRGNTYSRKHKYLDPNRDSASFFNFTYDEHGMYDLPAIIDYVLSETKNEKLFYIGHSQGTADFFILLSTRPEYNEKIQLGIALAPVAFVSNMISPLLRLLSINTELLPYLSSISGKYEVFSDPTSANFVSQFLCQFLPSYTPCSSFLYLLAGFEEKFVRKERLSSIIGHIPRGTSIKNLIHVGQAIRGEKFQRFDHGFDTNMKVYGSPEPPEYNLRNVTAPVVIIYGKNDWLASLKDVDKLKASLINLVGSYLIPDPEWTHLHFTWGKNIAESLAPVILNYTNTYSFGKF